MLCGASAARRDPMTWTFAGRRVQTRAQATERPRGGGPTPRSRRSWHVRGLRLRDHARGVLLRQPTSRDEAGGVLPYERDVRVVRRVERPKLRVIERLPVAPQQQARA